MTSTSPVGKLVAKLGERGQVARLRVLDDLPFDRRADPGKPRRLLVECKLRDRNGRLADARRGAAVGAQTESVGAVELEQVGQELELLGELGVGRQRLGHAGDDTRVRLVICLPTYNERANLEPIVRRLGEVLAGVDAEPRLLVIDDSSPDGTGELADRLSGELPFVSVLHRPRKEGLGPAYVEGFRWALEHGADRIVQMDADFSHDPADVPRLLGAAESAGLSLGSRYVEGGGTQNWGKGRQAISRFGSFYARTILGVRCPRSHGRVQVLAPRGPRGAAARSDSDEGLRLPGRDDLPRPPGRLRSRRGSDRLRRAPLRRVEDDARHRPRGRMEGARAPRARRP